MPLSVLNLTCSPLDDDDKLDAISLVQGSSSLLVEVGMPEVPAVGIQQSEVVPKKNPFMSESYLGIFKTAPIVVHSIFWPGDR